MIQEKLPAFENTFLGGLRVIELADELDEYCGRLLTGLGADIVKVEPPGGERTSATFLKGCI